VTACNGGNGTATQCRQKYTSRFILGSDAVWTLGDHAYPNAILDNFRIAYSPTWGRKKHVTYRRRTLDAGRTRCHLRGTGPDPRSAFVHHSAVDDGQVDACRRDLVDRSTEDVPVEHDHVPT
jgi:hypothetical protein